MQEFSVTTASRMTYLSLRNGRVSPSGNYHVYDSTISSRHDAQASFEINIVTAATGQLLPNGAVAGMKGTLHKMLDKPKVTLYTTFFEHQPGYSGFVNVIDVEVEGLLRTVRERELDGKTRWALKLNAGDADLGERWIMEYVSSS